MNAPLHTAHGMAGSTLVGPVLAVHGLNKSFEGRPILQNLGFAVAPGMASALIGANGSGKSTLLKCLIRLVEPDSGTIEMLGQAIGPLSQRDLRAFRARVGMVWQRHNLVPRLSALTNVVQGVQARLSGPRGWFQSLAPAAVRSEAFACLDRVGLADRALARVDSLSGGQQQRVAIARMLMQRPEFIMADEPDASLDPQSGEDVMRLLLELVRRDGLTLVVISHRLEHTLGYSDRILGLSQGHITLDIPTRQADAAQLRHFFDHEGRP